MNDYPQLSGDCAEDFEPLVSKSPSTTQPEDWEDDKSDLENWMDQQESNFFNSIQEGR